MSKAAYLTYLVQRMQNLEGRINADRDRLYSGSPREKVKASGDLALIERRLEETKQKLSRLEAEPEGAWEDFKAEIEQDFEYLEETCDRWVDNKA